MTKELTNFISKLKEERPDMVKAFLALDELKEKDGSFINAIEAFIKFLTTDLDQDSLFTFTLIKKDGGKMFHHNSFIYNEDDLEQFKTGLWFVRKQTEQIFFPEVAKEMRETFKRIRKV